MKKGFTQTLMMVAVVLMAAQAMAMAPIVSDIPSPVVGDAETATPANTFVYPDAIDLSKYVTDDTTTNTSIVWYYEVQGSGEHFYSINNAPEVTSSDDLTNPSSIATSKIIAGPGAQNTDTTGTTTAGSTLITIRNKHLSPIGGPNIAPDGDQTQLVTLYASDGETVTAKSVYFYTASGNDHLSTNGISCTQRTMQSTSDGFTYEGNGAVSHTVQANGICMSPGTSGDNTGIWDSPFGDLPLVKNAAYRIRLTVNGTQTTDNTTPLWDVLIYNYWLDPTNQTLSGLHGKMAYGADFWIFDGQGGQNANVQFVANAANGGDTTYDFWWTPSAVLTDRWNDTSATNPGVYSSAAGTDDKDAMIRFRMLDYRVTNADATTGLHGDKTQGTLCLKNMNVERFDLGSLTVDPTPVWQASAWTVGNTTGSAWNVTGAANASVTPASDGITVKANSGSNASANFYAALCPGDSQLSVSDAAVEQDDYPCPMDPKTLYKITVQLSAPTATDQANPIDAFWISSNITTYEEIQESYMTSMAYAHGMPSTGTPQQYVAFFYSNYGTNCAHGGLPSFWSAFRPYVAMTNSATFQSATKTGAIKVSGIKVEKVTGGFTN